MSDLLRYALEYAARGWPVFPCHAPKDGSCDCGKECDSPAKHPHTVNGFQAARTDELVIRGWWSRWTNANIAVRTGPDCGVVIDTDTKHDGEGGLAELERRFGKLPATVSQRTGSGGRHRFFRYPPGVRIGNRTKLAGIPGVDVRGDGGYVLVAPSANLAGPYEWLAESETLAELPPAWVELLANPPRPLSGESSGTSQRQYEDLSKQTLQFMADGADEGSRNDRLFKAAADHAGCNYSLAEAKQRLMPPAIRCGLKETEAQRTVESAYSQPRNPSIPTPVENQNIRANPIGGESARNEFPAPIPLDQLPEAAAVTWFWFGFLLAAHVTLLSSSPKTGKTTLLAYLLAAFRFGGKLIGEVRQAKVLVVSEESTTIWKRRQQALQIGPHVHVICRPFKMRLAMSGWLEFVAYVTRLIQEHRYDVVVVDTISFAWPVASENDAAEVLGALTPLYQWTATNAAVLIIHHLKKGDGIEASGARGSSALTGFVDVIMELRRFKADDMEDTRRKLRAYSRFDETTPEVVIQLVDKEYKAIGSVGEANQHERDAAILEMLTYLKWPTSTEIHDRWPNEHAPSKRTIEGDLNRLLEKGEIGRTGSGKKKDPFRWGPANEIRADATPYKGCANSETSGGEEYDPEKDCVNDEGPPW